MSNLKFEAFFHDPEDSEFPEDHAIADLGIAVGDDYLTRHEQRARLIQGGRKFTNSVHGSVAGLAEWFIENWSYLLWETQAPFRKGKSNGIYQASPAVPGAKEAVNKWEDYVYVDNEHYYDEYIRLKEIQKIADWQHRHMVGHASSDLAIPSIVVVPENKNILLFVDRLPRGSMAFYDADNAVRLPTVYKVANENFRSAVTAFIESVICHVESVGQHSRWVEWLRGRWREAQLNEAIPAKQLELMIGQVGADRVASLRGPYPEIAAGLGQLLLDCRIVKRWDELNPIEDVLRRYVGENGPRPFSGEIPGWQQLTGATLQLDQPEYIQGYKLARHVRKVLAVANRPIQDIYDVLRKMDVSLEEDRSIPLFRAAACATRGHEAYIIPSSADPRMSLQASRNFAAISAFGRLIWEARNPQERTICVAQGDYSILSDSRRANAFVAEFLLPSQVVSKFKYQSPELPEVADEYGISHEAANWHALDIERLSRT